MILAYIRGCVDFNPFRQGGAESDPPRRRPPQGATARAPLPWSVSGEGLAQGGTAWGEAEAVQRRSDPRRRFEPSGSAKPTRRAEAEARGESDRGGDRQGRGTRLRSPCRKTPEEATRERAGGAGGTQAHRGSGRAPLYLPAGKKADKGSEGKTALRAVLARDQRRGRPERLARIPLHWFLQDRKRVSF